MNARTPLVWLAGPLLLTATSAAQDYITLPPGSWANDVTPDGQVVVGNYGGGDGFVWRWRVDPSPTVLPDCTITGVSNDGTVVCGNIEAAGSGAQVAGRWTQSTGWIELPSIGGSCGSISSAYDISGDGNSIVGLGWNGCSGRGFLWTAASGISVELQNLVNGNNRASTISGNGQVIGGFAQSFSRTPAYWAPDATGFVVDQNLGGEVSGTNEDGSVTTGQIEVVGENWFQAYTRDAQGNLTILGSLNNGWAGDATDISEDGKVVVGFDFQGLARQAWIWTESEGIRSLDDRLNEVGITGFGPTLVCRACSDDGTVVVGGATDPTSPFGGSLGFIADFNQQPGSPWLAVGNGLAGTFGTPRLTGIGTLEYNSPTILRFSQGASNAPLAVILGLSRVDLPFQSGILVPSPDIVVPGFQLNAFGALDLPFGWLNGLPPGFQLFWQGWIVDAAGPNGWSATNGVVSTQP